MDNYKKKIEEALDQMEEADAQTMLNSALRGVMSNLDTVHTLYKKQKKDPKDVKFLDKLKKQLEDWMGTMVIKGE